MRRVECGMRKESRRAGRAVEAHPGRGGWAARTRPEARTGPHQRNRARTSGLTTFSAGHLPRLRSTMASAADSAMSSRARRSVPAAWGVSGTFCERLPPDDLTASPQRQAAMEVLVRALEDRAHARGE